MKTKKLKSNNTGTDSLKDLKQGSINEQMDLLMWFLNSPYGKFSIAISVLFLLAWLIRAFRYLWTSCTSHSVRMYRTVFTVRALLNFIGLAYFGGVIMTGYNIELGILDPGYLKVM